MELKDITKDAVIVSQTATFREALETMIQKQTNSLVVTDDEGTLTGEIHVSDLLDAVVPEYLDGDSIAAHFATEEMFEEAVKNASDKPVSEFMTVGVEPIQTDDSLMAVAANAIAHQKTSIPVVDHENRPIGVVSRRGVKHIIAKFLNIKDSA